jgi:Flp pilus assembly protein TadD
LRTGSIEEAGRVTQSFFDKAEMPAREAIRLASRNSDSYEGLAFVKITQSQWAEAEDLHKQALQLDPDNTEALDSYSITLAVTGRVRDALSEKSCGGSIRSIPSTA